MAQYQGHQHHRIFAALAFVDAHGVGQPQIRDFRSLIGHRFPFRPIREIHGHMSPLDAADPSDVPVEHVLVVIVPDLHHLVSFPEQQETAPVLLFLRGRGVHPGLEHVVQVLHPAQVLVHGGQHLDGVLGLPGGQMDVEIHNVVHGLLFRGEFPETEILFPFPLGHQSLVDPVGIPDNGAQLRLPEHVFQTDNGHGAAADYVLEHGAGAHAGQLVHVPHQDQPAAQGQGLQQVVHEHDVHHGGFVHDHRIGFQGIVLIPSPEGIPLPVGSVFQQPVHGEGRLPGAF